MLYVFFHDTNKSLEPKQLFDRKKCFKKILLVLTVKLGL